MEECIIEKVILPINDKRDGLIGKMIFPAVLANELILIEIDGEWKPYEIRDHSNFCGIQFTSKYVNQMVRVKISSDALIRLAKRHLERYNYENFGRGISKLLSRNA